VHEIKEKEWLVSGIEELDRGRI